MKSVRYQLPQRVAQKANLSFENKFTYMGLPFNISATAEASDFKFGAKLGFAKDHHKITRRRKGGVVLD